MIVPQKDLIHGELWMLTTAHQGQDITPEEHLDNSDTAIEIYITSLVNLAFSYLS